MPVTHKNPKNQTTSPSVLWKPPSTFCPQFPTFLAPCVSVWGFVWLLGKYIRFYISCNLNSKTGREKMYKKKKCSQYVEGIQRNYAAFAPIKFFLCQFENFKKKVVKNFNKRLLYVGGHSEFIWFLYVVLMNCVGYITIVFIRFSTILFFLPFLFYIYI